MPVEFQVDSIDAVDESLRGAYVEADGKFTLDPDKYAEVKAQGLKSKNKELLGKLSKANEGQKRFEKFAEFDDSDLEELLELRANKDKPADKKPGDDERLAQLEKQHKKALEKLVGEKTSTETKAADLERELKHFKLTVPVRDAAAKAGVIAEDLDLVILDTQKRFALNDEGKIVVLDEDGDPTDITLAKFFELYKEQRPKFYAASGAGGSGAPANTGNRSGTKTMTREAWKALPPQQQKAFIADVTAGKAALTD
jgi:hypothetical protein